jgi:hypothetical protein
MAPYPLFNCINNLHFNALYVLYEDIALLFCAVDGRKVKVKSLIEIDNLLNFEIQECS